MSLVCLMKQVAAQRTKRQASFFFCFIAAAACTFDILFVSSNQKWLWIKVTRKVCQRRAHHNTRVRNMLFMRVCGDSRHILISQNDAEPRGSSKYHWNRERAKKKNSSNRWTHIVTVLYDSALYLMDYARNYDATICQINYEKKC